MLEFIEFPNIKPYKIYKREYQINIFESIKNKNSLVVLPTGLGKTIIAILAIAYKARYGKVMFLAPTKPLCEQHYASLKELTTINEIFLVTGANKKEMRKEIYKKAHVIVATPQTIANDIDVIEWNEFSLVIFDEAHRAVGNYAYVAIAKKCMEYGVQIIGLTASPGSDYARLKEVIENLAIENIEVRSEYDRDVKPYVAERKIKWLLIPMPENIKKVAKKIDFLIREMAQELKNYVRIAPSRLTKKMLIELQQKLQKNLSKAGSYYNAISVVSAIIKLYHLKELLTSQSIDAAKEYVKKLETDASKAAMKIRKNMIYREIKRDVLGMQFENPKMKYVKKIVLQHLKEKENARIMIFAEYRDTIDAIVEELKKEGIKAARFIGQAKHGSNGMSQDKQKEVIKKFKEGIVNVLVSTSIGEEGIDIPATSLVLFYEPVPSAIRYIQRRGRTARAGVPGEVIILIMKGSRDEAYYWSSKRKEAKMMKNIKRLKEMIQRIEAKRKKKPKLRGQTKLDAFIFK